LGFGFWNFHLVRGLGFRNSLLGSWFLVFPLLLASVFALSRSRFYETIQARIHQRAASASMVNSDPGRHAPTVSSALASTRKANALAKYVGPVWPLAGKLLDRFENDNSRAPARFDQ